MRAFLVDWLLIFLPYNRSIDRISSSYSPRDLALFLPEWIPREIIFPWFVFCMWLIPALITKYFENPSKSIEKKSKIEYSDREKELIKSINDMEEEISNMFGLETFATKGKLQRKIIKLRKELKIEESKRSSSNSSSSSNPSSNSNFINNNNSKKKKYDPIFKAFKTVLWILIIFGLLYETPMFELPKEWFWPIFRSKSQSSDNLIRINVMFWSLICSRLTARLIPPTSKNSNISFLQNNPLMSQFNSINKLKVQ